MAATKTANTRATRAAGSTSTKTPILGAWWVIVGFALLLLLVLGGQLLLHPTWTAPTRDPAWYTWRANLILHANPGDIAREWGPGSVFSAGYRVTVPLAGAMLQRVAGISAYSFSAFLMVSIPVLTGLAFGAGAYRARKDPLVVLLMMFASAAVFLATPYVGYLDNIMVLFLLSLIVAFAGAARTSWGARAAVFMIAMAVAFTHPTTAVLFGGTLAAMFAFHFLTSRFSLGAALKADGPLLMATGFGMIIGLACWLAGIWGVKASLADAALPPPYTKSFFIQRLTQWIGSLNPLITGPLIVVAIVSAVLVSRRRHQPADQFTTLSAWWLFPFIGVLTILTGTLPYYRFLNATAAPIALTGLGAFVAVRFFLGLGGRARIAGALGVLLVVGSIGWLLSDGLTHRWVNEQNQWANENVRTSLAAVNVVVSAAGERPNILVMNYTDANDATGSNTAYGWAKTYTNVFRTGLSGESEKYSATYLGTVQNFLAGRPTPSSTDGAMYTEWSTRYFDEVQARRATYPDPPVAFVVGQYYTGAVDLQTDVANAVSVGPDVWVLTAPDLWTPPADVVARAQAAALAQQTAFADHPGPFGNPLHTLRVLLCLLLLAVAPGLIAAPFFELEDTPSRVALIPGVSIVMTLMSGIALLAVWRGSLTTTKAWAVVALTLGGGDRAPVRARPARSRPRRRRTVLRRVVLELLQP